MNIEILIAFLAWSTVINFAILIVWFLVFIFAHNWFYQFHGNCFKLPENTFNTIHYSAMAFYKLSIFIFNLVPYLVLRFLV